MPDKIYTIGEFAAINKVSTRMLRHYDKIGLLTPSAVAENGYRMYSSAQITAAGLIRKYRSCAFSLDEIAALLLAGADVSQLAQAKIQEFRQQEVLQKDALCRLYELTSTQGYAAFHNPYEISFTHKNSQQLLCGKCSSSENQIDVEFEKLHNLLSRMGVNPVGPGMLLSDISEEKGYRAAVPIEKRFGTADFDFTVADAGQYLSTLHYGDYYEIACAYDKLILYAEQQGLERSGVFIERYFLDSVHTVNPNEYITEISVKITP